MEFENMKETCASSRNVFDGKVLHVFVDDINLPDGARGFREYIKHGGAVAVLPLTDDGEVICVRQYRYAIGRVTTEIPAGKLDAPTEDHREAALRELREETGARCERFTFLGTYIGSPAILDEKIDIYLAEGLCFGETDFDEDEFIEIERIPLATLVEDAMAGRIMDGKTLYAIFKVNELLRRRREGRA
ncbi:MAG: NUDIX hydrolase [Ruminococcaceae bacterium]|nr:NUDIX hydrolase [Oscillospiraceae bacterium]